MSALNETKTTAKGEAKTSSVDRFDLQPASNGNYSVEDINGIRDVLSPTVSPSSIDCAPKHFSEVISFRRQLPSYLQNLFEVTGYFNPVALKTFNDEDINNIENFAKHDLVDILQSSGSTLGSLEFEKYYGSFFKNHPDKLKILRGHRKVIESARTSFCTSLETSVVPGPGLKVKFKNEKLTEINLQKNSGKNQPIDLAVENKDVRKQILSTQRDIFLKLHPTETQLSQFNTMLETQKVETKIGFENNIICHIECIFCDQRIKIFKSRKREEYSYRWVGSNYYKHFRAHTRNGISDLSALLSGNSSMKRSLVRGLRHVPNKINKISSKISNYFPKLGSEVKTTHHDTSDTTESIQKENIGENVEETDPEGIQSKNEEKVIEVVIENIDKSQLDIPQSDMAANSVKDSKDMFAATDSKFSRTDRKKRKLMIISENQTFINDYYELVNKMLMLIEENRELKNLLVTNAENLNILSKMSETEQLPTLLQILNKSATKNNAQKSQGNRYTSPLKKFCAYIFCIGGRLMYETLYANLSGTIPSITTVCREYYHSDDFEEGDVRIKELAYFLETRNLPKIIWLSEDATGVTGRIRYSSIKNRNIGFVLPLDKYGFPDNSAFKATSLLEIKRQFDEESVAKYGYVMVAQPL